MDLVDLEDFSGELWAGSTSWPVADQFPVMCYT